MSGTCWQRAYDVGLRSPCGCDINVRRQYLHALLTYGVLNYSLARYITACKYGEREFILLAVGWYNIKRPTDAPRKSQLSLLWNADPTTALIAESAFSCAPPPLRSTFFMTNLAGIPVWIVFLKPPVLILCRCFLSPFRWFFGGILKTNDAITRRLKLLVYMYIYFTAMVSALTVRCKFTVELSKQHGPRTDHERTTHL